MNSIRGIVGAMNAAKRDWTEKMGRVHGGGLR